MRRPWPFLPSVFALAFIAMPYLAHAASLVAIIPTSGSCVCAGSAPDFGCVLQVFQTFMTDFVAFITVILTFFIAQAGFSYILNPTNPEKRSQANKRLMNAVIGILIVLCAWLLVDTVMKTIYSGTTGTTTSFGPWNSILQSNGNDYCIVAHANPGALSALSQITNPANGAGGALPAGATSPGASTASSATGSNASANTRGDCTPTGLASDGMDSSITATMSCITKTEDTSCALGALSGTDKGTDGKSVSIGMFQINISANNLSQYPACEAAVNNQPLNCTQAFAGGAYTASNHQTHVSNPSLYAACVAAASNAACNVQSAQDQYTNHGGSRNWGTAAQNNCGR